MMPIKQRLWSTFVLPTMLVLSTQAQTGDGEKLIAVASAEAQEHLAKQVPPIYPNIARIAHVQGPVMLHASIAKDGSVNDVRVLSGPPMLVPSSVAAIKQWRYKPFVREQQPVTAEVEIIVRFSLADNDPDSTNFSRWLSKCKTLVTANDYSTAESVCLVAVKMADKLPPNRLSDREEAYGYGAQALLLQNEFPASLDHSRHELELAQKMPEDEFQLSNAHHHVARGLQGIGNLKQANYHYKQAAKSLKRARKGIPKNDYVQAMQSLLQDYAMLLRQSGDASGAEKAERAAVSRLR
jgi:TonB family protein